MKKILALLLLFSLPFALSAEIIVGDMHGKVQIMKPGSSAWEMVNTGDTLPQDSTISTGFNSRVQLKVNEATKVELKPLTRLSIEEAVASSGGDQSTKLFMGSGRIRASVKKNKGKSHNFQVRTPVATAAVRGTAFDMTPRTLKVNEGIVRFSVGNDIYHFAEGQRSAVSLAYGQKSLQAPLKGAVETRQVSIGAGPRELEISNISDAGNRPAGFVRVTLK